MVSFALLQPSPGPPAASPGKERPAVVVSRGPLLVPEDFTRRRSPPLCRKTGNARILGPFWKKRFPGLLHRRDVWRIRGRQESLGKERGLEHSLSPERQTLFGSYSGRRLPGSPAGALKPVRLARCHHRSQSQQSRVRVFLQI